MSVSNTLEWLRKSAELTQGSESHAFMLAYECLNNALTTVEEDKKYIVRIERELRAANTLIEMARNTLVAPAGRPMSAGSLSERAAACHEILSTQMRDRVARITTDGVDSGPVVSDPVTTTHNSTPERFASEWEFGHTYQEMGYTHIVDKAEFIARKPSGNLSDGTPYWNYTQHRRRKAGPWIEVTRQNDHGSVELSAPAQDGDTP